MNKTGLLLPVMVILLAGCTAAQSPASTGAATAQQSVEAAADGQSSSAETAAEGEQAADAEGTAQEAAAAKKQLRTIVIPRRKRMRSLRRTVMRARSLMRTGALRSSWKRTFMRK